MRACVYIVFVYVYISNMYTAHGTCPRKTKDVSIIRNTLYACVRQANNLENINNSETPPWLKLNLSNGNTYNVVLYQL